MNVSAAGYRTARRRVQRTTNEHELVADFTIARDLSMLAAVKVVADKAVKASNSVNPTSPETGASERWSDGVGGQLSPTSLGNVSAFAWHHTWHDDHVGRRFDPRCSQQFKSHDVEWHGIGRRKFAACCANGNTRYGCNV